MVRPATTKHVSALAPLVATATRKGAPPSARKLAMRRLLSPRRKTRNAPSKRKSGGVADSTGTGGTAQDSPAPTEDDEGDKAIPLIWLAAAGRGMQGRMTEVAVPASPESLPAAEAAQPHRH
eukprot:jgi/Tetstr1/423897/TSEL_014520.t1